jgi:steroid 5-alpha reductase family enzyme
MFIVGLLIEAVSDQQKFNYRFQVAPQFREQGRQAPIIRRGLWRYSRQPNYFGEILLWWGLFVMCLDHQPLGYPQTYWSIISPLFLSFLLLGLSGLPLAERGMQKRYLSADCKDVEAKRDYLEYRLSTSPLIPLPNGFYRKLPLPIKRWLLFEWPIYETKWLQDALSSESNSE